MKNEIYSIQLSLSISFSARGCLPQLFLVDDVVLFFYLFVLPLRHIILSDNAWLIGVVRFEWQFPGDYQAISFYE